MTEEQYQRQILPYAGFTRSSQSACRQKGLLIQPVSWQGYIYFTRLSNLFPLLTHSVGVECCRVQHWSAEVEKKNKQSWDDSEIQRNWFLQVWHASSVLLRWFENKELLGFGCFSVFSSFPEDLYPPFSFTHLALKMLECTLQVLFTPTVVTWHSISKTFDHIISFKPTQSISNKLEKLQNWWLAENPKLILNGSSKMLNNLHQSSYGGRKEKWTSIVILGKIIFCSVLLRKLYRLPSI